jgi:hypothetical protein
MKRININQLDREVRRFDNEPHRETKHFINLSKPKWKQTGN